MRTLAVLMVIAATSAAAPVPKELKKTDLNRIAGTWALTGSSSAVGTISPPDGSVWKFEADGKATIIRKAGDEAAGIKFKIDETASPKSFDWICPWGEWYGVYELTGDTITIFIRGKSDPKGRAAELKPGDGVEMYSFKRIESGK